MRFPTWLAGPAQHQGRMYSCCCGNFLARILMLWRRAHVFGASSEGRAAAIGEGRASGLRSLLVLSIDKLVQKSLHSCHLLLSIGKLVNCLF
jgi:hypothetical protein